MKKLGFMVLSYILGLKLKPRPVFSNDGISDHTIVLCSCHPLDSITWHWALYANKPKSIKWLIHPGIILRKQKLMRK